jgi:hypothetical protein
MGVSPVKKAKKPGIRGIIQGEKKERSPAAKDVKINSIPSHPLGSNEAIVLLLSLYTATAFSQILSGVFLNHS